MKIVIFFCSAWWNKSHRANEILHAGVSGGGRASTVCYICCQDSSYARFCTGYTSVIGNKFCNLSFHCFLLWYEWDGRTTGANDPRRQTKLWRMVLLKFVFQILQIFQNLYKTHSIEFSMLSAIEQAKFHPSSTTIGWASMLWLRYLFLQLTHTAGCGLQLKNRQQSQKSLCQQ